MGTGTILRQKKEQAEVAALSSLNEMSSHDPVGTWQKSARKNAEKGDPYRPNSLSKIPNQIEKKIMQNAYTLNPKDRGQIYIRPVSLHEIPIKINNVYKKGRK